MIDYMLKFPDEATANEVLEPFIVTHSIDVIGIIYKPTGAMIDTQDGPAFDMAAIPGWHVNVRGGDEEVEALAEYRIFPTNPVRGWA